MVRFGIIFMISEQKLKISKNLSKLWFYLKHPLTKKNSSVCLFPWARDIYSPKVLVIPRNRWLRLNMTEKLFTGTLNHNQNKNKKQKRTRVLKASCIIFFQVYRVGKQSWDWSPGTVDEWWTWVQLSLGSAHWTRTLQSKLHWTISREYVTLMVLTHCMLGNFSCIFVICWFFFKINFLKKSFQEYHQFGPWSDAHANLRHCPAWSGSKLFAKVMSR